MPILDVPQVEERLELALNGQRTPEPNSPAPAHAAYPSLKPFTIGLLPGNAMAQMTEMAVAVAKRLRLEQLDASEASSFPVFHSSETPRPQSASDKHKQPSSSGKSRPGSSSLPLPHTVPSQTSTPIKQLENMVPALDRPISRSPSRSRPGSAARALAPEISGPVRDPSASRSSSQSRPGSAACRPIPEIMKEPGTSRSPSRSRPGSAARALAPEISGPRVNRSVSVADRRAAKTDRSRWDPGNGISIQESLDLLTAPRRSLSRSLLAVRPSSARLPSESGRSRGSGAGRSVAASSSKSNQDIGSGRSSRNMRENMEVTGYPPWPPGSTGGSGEGGCSLSRSGSRSRQVPLERVDSPSRGLESPKSSRRTRGTSGRNDDRAGGSTDKPSRSLRVGQQGLDGLSEPLRHTSSAREASRQRPPRPPSSQSDRQQQRQALQQQELQEEPAMPPQSSAEYILGPTQQRRQALQQVHDQHQQQERITRPTSRSSSSKMDRKPQRPASGGPGPNSTSCGRRSRAAGDQIERSASFSSHSDPQTSVRSDMEAAIRAELAAAVAAAVAAVASPFSGVSDQPLDTRTQGPNGLAAGNPPRRPAPPIIPGDIVGKVKVASELRTSPDSALHHAAVAASEPLVSVPKALGPLPAPLPAPPMPQTESWPALESQLSEPMLESMAPQPRSEPQLPSPSGQPPAQRPPSVPQLPSAPQQSSTPQMLLLPEGLISPLPYPPVANTGKPTTTLTPATLAARLHLPRPSRSPATSLRNAASGSLPAATSANAVGSLFGSPLTLREASNPLGICSDGDGIPVPSSSLEADAQILKVEVLPSGSASSTTKSPQPTHNRYDRSGPTSGKAGSCGDGRGPHMGPYAGGINVASGSCLERIWQQYPGEAGSHPDMMKAAGGTLPLLYGNDWEDLTHEVVWRVARSFGFQVFNINPETKFDHLPQWTPATAFLVSEHLCRILVHNMLPRMKPPANAMHSNASCQTGAGVGVSVTGASSSIYGNTRQASTAASGVVTTVAGSPGGLVAGGPVNDYLTSDRYSSISSLPLGPAAEAAEAAAAAGSPRFAMAVYELHNTVFYAYEQRWCPHLDLRPRPRELQRVLEMTRWADSAALNGLLSELALYFLLYSEGANLRHTPELMWFLFWSAVHSPNMERLWREGLPNVRREHRGAWGRRIWLRTQFQREIGALQAKVGAPPGSRPHPPPLPQQQPPTAVPPDLATAALPAFSAAVTEMLLASAAAAATASPLGSRLTAALSPSDTDLLADLAAYGDGGLVMDRVVTPLFHFLSHEMDALFEAGVEVAHRLGYDDVNESMCRRDVVDPLLYALGVSEDALVFGEVLDIWRALTELGCTCPAEPSMPSHVGPSPKPFDAQIAANFWSSEVFVKTFRERRSWAAIFRAFFRVYCLQLVLLTLIMAAAFAPGDAGALTSAVITHAWLSAAERIANWWLSLNPPDPLLIRQEKKARAEAQASAAGMASPNSGGEDDGGGTKNGDRGASIAGSRGGRFWSGRGTLAHAEASGHAGETSATAAGDMAGMEEDLAAPPVVESPQAARVRRRLVPMEGQPLIGGLVGCLDWVLFAFILTALYVVYWEDPGGTGILHRLHLGLRIWWLPFSMAYGGAIVLLGVLTTRAGYRVSILSWTPALRYTLACHSAMPPAGCWLEGYLGVDWKAWATNTAMWLIILAVKVAFEYYIIAKPLVAPMRALLKHNFPGCSSWPCSHVSWFLAALRALPLCMICLADTSIIYNAVMALFGILRGLLRLDLGTVASWEELRAAFHRGPVRWWRRCMSAEGVSSHRRALRRHLMEGGQDRAAVEAFVPETPAAQNNISSDEDSEDGASNSSGAADGAMSNDNVEDHSGDEDRLSCAATMPSSMGSKALGLMWPLRTMGRGARWARERRALGRIRENGGASALAIMEPQDGDESQNLMLQAAERWATVPELPPLMGSSFISSRRRAGGGGTGMIAPGSTRAGGNGARWEALEPLHRRRGPIRRPSIPGSSMERSRRRFSDGGGARAVAEGLEKAERSDVNGNSSTGGPGPESAADAGRSGLRSRSGGGAAGAAVVISNARRPRISGSEGEVERRLVGPYSPVIRNPAKASDVSGLWQRLPRRSTPSGAAGGASCGSVSGTAASTRGWGIFMRHNSVAPLPLSPPVTDVPALSTGSPPGTRRVASFGGAAGANFGGVECLVTPRRPAFPVPRIPAGPVAEATSTPSTPLGLTRLTRREAASLAVHEQTLSPTTMHATRRNPAADGWRQRDQDHWQQRQRQLLSSAAASPPARTPIPQTSAAPPMRQTTSPRVDQPQLLTRASLGSLSDLSSDRDDPEAARGEIPAARARDEAVPSVTAPTAAPSAKVDAEAVYRRPSQRPPGFGSETTERDRVMALKSTEDLSLGVLLSRQNGDLAMWDAFATVWDGIVDDLRAADLISDRESGNLRFMRLGHFQGRHALRPILLPAFFYAGVVQAFVDTGRLASGGGGGDGATTTILTELRSLVVWLSCELRLLSEAQAEVVMGTSFLHTITDVDHANYRAKMLHAGQALVKQLAELCASAAKQQQQLLQQPRELQRQQRQRTDWHQVQAPGGQVDFENGAPAGGKPSNVPTGARMGRTTPQRQAATAATKAMVALHIGAIGGSLREVLEALAGEARAMRRAVASGRLASESLEAAVKLEEVAQQVLADLSAHPEFLSSCLNNLLPSTIFICPPRATYAEDDEPESPTATGSPPSANPTAASYIQTPQPIPSNFVGGNLTATEVPLIHLGSPSSARSTEPRGIANGGASSSPLHHGPPAQGATAITTAFPDSPNPSISSAVVSGIATAGAGAATSLPRAPSLARVKASEDFLAKGMRKGGRSGSSWGSGSLESVAPPPLEPEVVLRVRVVEVLVKMLTTPASACRPAGAEALRILGFFINSLSNPQLKKPPPLSDMLSWSVLTPCYEEDVLYPLSADHAARQLGLAPPPHVGPGRPPDLLSETEDNVSLMSYLRSVFPDDWKNFMERLSGMLGGADLSRVTENDFAPMGPLHGLAAELQLWATYRGQLLGRTVRGMMCYRRAVRMLVELEYPRPAGVSPEAYNAWAEAFVDCKFQYVCTCQVYGKNRKATDIRRRWLAEGVDSLCLEFPALRVAYLDSAVTSYGPTEYSVLLRGNPDHPAARAGAARGVASAEATASAISADGGALSASAPAQPLQPPQQPQPPGAVPRALFSPRPPSNSDGICFKIASVEGEGSGKGKDGSSYSKSSETSSAAVRSSAAAATVSSSGSSPTLELYRIRLPYNRYGKRGVILGEGKPENQNHASIFCFGEALQTIDMNQDNALAEALKMRNLLRELAPEPAPRRLQAVASHPRGSTSSEHHRHAIAARTAREVPVALVGFREWIFSDVSGALGTFAAACELAFGTIVQRTMSYPGRVRLHYGHPDVFNKMHIMTRGGLSKATRQLHISEDVFGGFNQLLRGAQIKYKEYISCGKGRDMGFDSINAFEIKISGGGGECVVSRDVARLAPRMDLARLLHFYHSGPGYYINSLFIMTAVWLNIWVVAVFALARASTVQRLGSDGNLHLEDTLRVEHALSLGPLMLLPYAAQLLLEWGALRTFATLAVQIISGSVAFAVFRQQTTAYYFKDDITYGGARYISTGRGFSITSSSFTTLFTNYARSHLYPGMELLHLLLLYASVRDCKSCSFAAVTWGTWLVAVSLLFSPFWFNPMAFTREKVSRDWSAWLGWMRGEVDPATGNNWDSWNRKQLEKVRNERGTVTDPWLNIVSRLVEEVAPRWVLVVAAVSRLDLMIDVRIRALSSPLVPFFAATALIWLVTLLSWALQRHFEERGRGRAWRLYRVMMSALVATALLSYSVFAVRFFRGTPMSNLALLLYANSQLVLAVHRALEQLAPASSGARALVDRGYWLVDWGVGTLLMCLVTLLAWLGFVSRLQTRLLFNSTFAASIRRGKLVRSTGLMKLDEEQRWRNEGQARAALAQSVAMSFRKHTTPGVHYGAPPLQPGPGATQPQRYW